MQDEDPYADQKYSFYEIVIIDSKKEHLSQYNGRRGFIEGKLDPSDYRPGDDKTISYGVRIDGVREGWDIDECDLKPTGEFVDPNSPEIEKWWPSETT